MPWNYPFLRDHGLNVIISTLYPPFSRWLVEWGNLRPFSTPRIDIIITSPSYPHLNIPWEPVLDISAVGPSRAPFISARGSYLFSEPPQPSFTPLRPHAPFIPTSKPPAQTAIIPIPVVFISALASPPPFCTPSPNSHPTHMRCRPAHSKGLTVCVSKYYTPVTLVRLETMTRQTYKTV